MPELIVQQVESVLIERIKSLASERNCSINDVLLKALRDGLNVGSASGFRENRRDAEDLSVLASHWNSEEKGVFEEALSALAQAPATQLAPANIRHYDATLRPK